MSKTRSVGLLLYVDHGPFSNYFIAQALQTRADDYSIIGLTLSSLLTPTILYKRASLLSLVLGGGILGLSGGVYAHLWKSIQEGYEVKPDLEGMVADVEEAGGKAVGDVKKVVESRR